MADPVPNPGSREAKEAGCRCPSLDNARGRGVFTDEKGVPQFWITDGCPLHGKGRSDG